MKKSSLKKSSPPEPPAAPRTLLLVEFFGRGGLLHYSAQLARALAASVAPGVAVTLVCGRALEPGVVPGEVRCWPRLATWNPHARPRYIPRPMLRAARGLRYLWAWGQLLRLVARVRPDLVLLGDLEHRCDAWGVGRLRRSLHCQPRPGRLADLWHNIESFGRQPGEGVLRHPAWRVRMARQFDTVLVHGPTLARQFTELTGRPAVAIAHGHQGWLAELAGPDPHLDQRCHLPSNAPLGLLFGALSPYKGIEGLLAALALLPPAERPHILIAGQPTAAVSPTDWRAQAAQLGLAQWLHWDLGYVPTPDTAWYFRRADFVVLPYRAAAQSGVAHLALTFAKPLLVTSVGGLPELVDGNGLVVPPDDPAALAAALGVMAAEPRLRQQWGERARQLVTERHDWRAIAQRLLSAAAPQLLPQPVVGECYQGMTAKEGARESKVASDC